MEKTTLGLIAALGAAATAGSAQAAVPPVDEHSALHASSVGELLDPIPNALEVMKATQAKRAAEAEKTQQVAQIYFGFGHHHHWHHHHHWYHHHHHHHWYHHHHWHHHHWHHHHHEW